MKGKICCFLSIACWLLISPQAKSQEVLPAETMATLVPKYFKGYRQDKETVAKLITLGEIKYSLCEKRFRKDNQYIKILLFDFAEAPIMYNQAMRRWSQLVPTLTDSLVQKSVVLENCAGWGSFNLNSKTSQLFLGIYDRFFLSLSGENMDLVALEETLGVFRLKNFPK